jgi:hypothetical protein
MKSKKTGNGIHIFFTVYSVMTICLLNASLASAEVIWDHWSPLTVHEEITNLGSGQYKYTYSFVNEDTSPIWSFGVCSNVITTGNGNFTDHSSWLLSTASIEFYSPEYDARNLDPDIQFLAITLSQPFVNQSTAIQIGEHASGFYFTAFGYDPSPKYYFYETIASGYILTNGTGKVAVVGLTPEPATILLLAFGGLFLRRRK